MQMELYFINLISHLYHYVKVFLCSVMDTNNLEYLYQIFIQILIQNPLNHLLTL